MIDAQLNQLSKSLIELEKARKIHAKVLNEAISKLPEDKRQSAKSLFQKAKKGKISIEEIMSFAGKIPNENKVNDTTR